MMIEFFKKLEKSKWLPWVGTAPFILIPFVIMFDGEVARGVGILAFFASMWVGIILGGKLAQIFSTRVFKVSDDVAKRLTAAFCAFGFLFIVNINAVVDQAAFFASASAFLASIVS